MRDINKITTEQLREASSKGFVSSLGYRSIADEEFDYWLVRERNRVAELAKKKEQQRIIAKLDQYKMYRFEKEWMIELIEGE